MRILTTALCAGILALTLVACNIRGFFISQTDDPVWNGPSEEQSAGDQNQSLGAKLFNKNCASCHQTTGKGITGSIPPLAGSALANSEDVTKPIRIVLHGFRGAIVRNGVKYNGVMQPWHSVFTDEEIAAILTHVRTSWGNTGGEVKPEDVARVREATKSRTTQYTEAELEQPL
ncbi:MAG: cytochrome c [Chlorobi bacterium]|jgi:mono/diheme cytochrome c family protein|nr:cytochrome c [Chlorobiota bacterium]